MSAKSIIGAPPGFAKLGVDVAAITACLLLGLWLYSFVFTILRVVSMGTDTITPAEGGGGGGGLFVWITSKGSPSGEVNVVTKFVRGGSFVASTLAPPGGGGGGKDDGAATSSIKSGGRRVV